MPDPLGAAESEFGPEVLAITTRSEAETMAIGKAVGEVLAAGDVVLLRGELGAGKTRFVEGMTRGIETDAETRSPTFVLVNEYAGRLMLAHCDLYRLSGPEEIGELGLAVEWPERARDQFPEQALEIDMGFGEAPNDRLLKATATGEAACHLLAAMRAAAETGRYAGSDR